MNNLTQSGRGKMKIKEKLLTKFDSLLEDLVNAGAEFSLSDKGNTIGFSLPEEGEIGFYLELHRNGTYELS